MTVIYEPSILLLNVTVFNLWARLGAYAEAAAAAVVSRQSGSRCSPGRPWLARRGSRPGAR